jgi:signal transduction histidine kinase/CheY-like chemotaxis protein
MSENILKYFKLFYDNFRLPIQVVDETGGIFYTNEMFTVQWGYNITELTEYNIFKDVELKRNGVLESIREVMQKEIYSTITNYSDSLLLNREAALPYYRTSMFTTVIEDKKFLVMIHEDQTEMVLTEEEVKKARDANKEAERLKSTFLNVLSHELRTPLNIILGYSTIIKESLKEKISNEDKIYLDNLYSGSERLFKSITQMLEFAQIEAGNYHLNLDVIDIVSVFNRISEQFRKNAVAKNLDFKLNFEEEKLFVEVDLQCLENVIINLMDNAVKFTHHGFIDVEMESLKSSEQVVCKIKDTGIGISTEYLDHLYRPFSQEDLDVGRNFEGNGLGLALSKKYIEKMGGSLLVDSIKGVGSTFTFTLPMAKNGSKTNAVQPVKVDRKTIRKILMVDDTRESYELLKAFLKDKFETHVVNYKAFNDTLLDDESVNILIFDVTKNYWDRGLDLCKHIKSKDSKKRPIIILSSEFMKDRIQMYFDAGANEFLVKPFAKNEIIRTIEKALS